MMRTMLHMCGFFFGASVIGLGCSASPTEPVTGQVVWEDGTPAVELEQYSVEAELPEGKTVTRGNIGPDGRFTLSTFRPNDGAEPGEYKAIITPIPRTEIDPPLKVTIPTKYQSYEKSELRFTVTRGQKNEPVLKISKK